MKSILKDLLGLLASIFVFFNLDTLSPGASTISSASPATKVLAVVAVLAILAGWRFWTRYSIYLPLLLVISTSFVIFAIHPKQTHWQFVNALETIFLSIFVYFSYAVSKWMSYVSDEFEHMLMKNINNPIAKLTDSLDEVNKCLYQSRRSGHPLSIILLDVKKNPNPALLTTCQEKIFRELAKRYLTQHIRLRLINRIISGFRRSDVIAMCTEYESRLIIMCPSTSIDECNTVIQRIQDNATRELDLPVSLGTASFPNDGFTLEALIKTAETHLVEGKPDLPMAGTEEQAA